MPPREEIRSRLERWYDAWNNHDLERVMELFHDDIVFENWTGARVTGKAALKKAWAPWFAENGDFVFHEEDTFVDESEQKALYRWRLEWASPKKKGHRNRREVRCGVDVIRFKDGRIIEKLTYSKTTVEIDGKRRLVNV